MLAKPYPPYARGKLRATQRGVTLMIALIVLVAMTLTGIALVRSVDTTNIIAGNLAFQQAATHSGDRGVEAAIIWLEANNGGVYLQANHNTAGDALGYSATRQDPAAGQSWDAFWNNTLSASQKITPPNQPDAAGNTVTYTIHRMCLTTGDPVTPGTGCAVSPVAAVMTANSQNVGAVALQYSSQVYYRITSRIAGPRNTVSYVQAIVAL